MSCRTVRVVLVVAAAAALQARAPRAASVLEFVAATYSGVGGVTGLNYPAGLAVSPDGKHVYAASKYDSTLLAFRRDARTGVLAFVQSQSYWAGSVDGLNGACSVAVSPDGAHVYVASDYDRAVAVFRRDGATGGLTFVEAEYDGQNGVNGLDSAVAVAVTADGAHVYVAGRFDNAVAAFARNPATGALTFVEATVNGVGGVDGLSFDETLALAPDGRHLYAAGSSGSKLATFARDPATGRLTFVRTNTLSGTPAWVAVSPDNRHVYVAASFDIYAYARDAATGALTLVEEESTTDREGTKFPDMVAVSPGGEHVYLASSFDDALAVYTRDVTTGALTFVEAHLDGRSGVEGMQGARFVAVSPNGAHVYVAGADDDAVAVFWKDFPVEFVAGNEAYFAQDWVAAEQHFTTMLAQEPSSATLRNNRGLARCKQGDYAGAAADFAAAKGLDPTYVAPFVNQGKCLAMQGDLAGARAEFTAGLALDPGHVKLLYGLGWVEAEEGDYGAAVSRYDAALVVDPSYGRALVARGVALAEQGEPDAAVGAFYDAINKAPSGDLFATVAAFDLQLLRGPGVAFGNATAARDYLDGIADLGVGLFAQAGAHFTSARTLEPSVAEVPWMLALSRLRRLDSSGAKTAWAEARALMPTLTVSSTQGAQLFVDGMFRGNTPQTVPVFASRVDLAFRRSEGPMERTLPAYADGTPGGASPITATMIKVTKFSLFAPENDTDRDWLGDAWEIAEFGTLHEGPAGDSDRDGVDNLREYWAASEPGPGGDQPRVRKRVLLRLP